MTAWYDRLASLVAAGVDCVVVTVVATKGSTPREPGTRMIVTADRLFGTVGGGNLEYRATDIARRIIGDGMDAPALHDFPLGPSLGQCCGGHATLCFEPFVGVKADQPWIDEVRRSLPCMLVSELRPGGTRTVAVGAGSFDGPKLVEDGETILLVSPVRPPELTVCLFGAGHVGQALVRVLADLPCRISWIDSRAEQFPDALPDNVTAEISAAAERDVDDAAPGSFFLVMTHSHQLDLQICERILRRGDFAYLGLIGSATKRKRFEARLARKGLSPAVLGRLICPIGVPGISGKHPAKIAIAVAAEILQRLEAADREAGFEQSTLSA